jgi:adenosylhomocysteine nucleosidase
MQRLINFIVALPSEAAPLIDALRLSRCTRTSGVKLYQRDNFRLIVCGVGKIAAATAVGYIAGTEQADTQHIWLNVGIAGHSSLPKGSVGIAHQVTDKATGTTHYPAFVFRAPCASYALVCHDAPTTTYAGDAMCDMESVGFFAAATRFSTVEFIHSIKIISDNSTADIKAINRTNIRQMIEAHVALVVSFANLLEDIAVTHLTPAIPLPLDSLLARWHFTATQKTQLTDIARRWALVRSRHHWPTDELEGYSSSREVITHLRAVLDHGTPKQPTSLAT